MRRLSRFLRWFLGRRDTSESPYSPDRPARAIGRLADELGRRAVDLSRGDGERTKARYERWAEHFLDGVPSPNRGGGPSVRSPADCDWGGFQRFASGQRRDECSFVLSTMSELRQALWGFVRELSRDAFEARSDDEEITTQLEQLRLATKSRSLQELRKQAKLAVDVMGKVLDKRHTRQRLQVRELGNQLRLMRQELEQARHEMAIDPLTRLFNRAAFDEQLARISELNVLSGEPACLVMVDIDHFKAINDTHGHPTGDEVLKMFSALCVSTFPRRSDFVARYGGEEFSILFQQDPLHIAERLANRFLARIRDSVFEHEDREITMTASIGIAELAPGERPTAWLKRADEALYRAKSEGRDRVAVADREAVPSPG